MVADAWNQNAPKFQRATPIQNHRNITIHNSDNIQIHIDNSGKGVLHNAANEVRQALAQRDRERSALIRRMLTDQEVKTHDDGTWFIRISTLDRIFSRATALNGLATSK